ncbi:MAG: hypothetical protein JO134_15665 [Xanthobacteraceae bacterium]|nr:hypothetical protein [Xanthobacteraceae bacterium]
MQAKAGPAPDPPRREAVSGLRRHRQENDAGGRHIFISTFGAAGASAPPAVTATMPPDPTTRTAPDTAQTMPMSGSDYAGKSACRMTGIEIFDLLETPDFPA